MARLLARSAALLASFLCFSGAGTGFRAFSGPAPGSGPCCSGGCGWRRGAARCSGRFRPHPLHPPEVVLDLHPHPAACAVGLALRLAQRVVASPFAHQVFPGVDLPGNLPLGLITMARRCRPEPTGLFIEELAKLPAVVDFHRGRRGLVESLLFSPTWRLGVLARLQPKEV